MGEDVGPRESPEVETLVRALARLEIARREGALGTRVYRRRRAHLLGRLDEALAAGGKDPLGTLLEVRAAIRQELDHGPGRSE